MFSVKRVRGRVHIIMRLMSYKLDRAILPLCPLSKLYHLSGEGRPVFRPPLGTGVPSFRPSLRPSTPLPLRLGPSDTLKSRPRTPEKDTESDRGPPEKDPTGWGEGCLVDGRVWASIVSVGVRKDRGLSHESSLRRRSSWTPYKGYNRSPNSDPSPTPDSGDRCGDKGTLGVGPRNPTSQRTTRLAPPGTKWRRWEKVEQGDGPWKGQDWSPATLSTLLPLEARQGNCPRYVSPIPSLGTDRVTVRSTVQEVGGSMSPEKLIFCPWCRREDDQSVSTLQVWSYLLSRDS